MPIDVDFELMFLFSISSTYNDDPVKNQIAAALVQRIVQAARDGQKFKVCLAEY